jgi:tRNA dimethylallyltransferase
MTATPGAVPVVAVVGPTASGKSALAVDLALATGGEVVNGDAMQVYRGMDIGTAKLSLAERRGVPHHVLDMLDVTQTSTVADFQGWARAAIEDCRSRGVMPVLTGGSALYLRAVLDEFEFPGTDTVVRARLEAELGAMGAPALHARLAAVDPAAAAAILPSNGRRIVRALEVVEISARPFPATLPQHTYALEGVLQIGLDIPREDLDRRIEERVRGMWSAGFLDEVARLRAAGLETGRTASRALGYRQVLAFLAGDLSEEQAFLDTVARTRRFARRQDSWFKKDPRIRWLPYDDPDLLERALGAVRFEA